MAASPSFPAIAVFKRAGGPENNERSSHSLSFVASRRPFTFLNSRRRAFLSYKNTQVLLNPCPAKILKNHYEQPTTGTEAKLASEPLVASKLLSKKKKKLTSARLPALEPRSSIPLSATQLSLTTDWYSSRKLEAVKSHFSQRSPEMVEG